MPAPPEMPQELAKEPPMTFRSLLFLSALTVVTTSPASAQGSSLELLIRTGLEDNPHLAARRAGRDQSEARWAASRAARYPAVSVDARYSVADGGRTFDVPVGELLNPAYTTLNDILGEPRFPSIDNQRFALLRDREQDTRLRLTQVLWSPSLGADVRSKRSLMDADEAGLEATTLALVRDIRIAYYRLANAARAEAVLDAALELVTENERARTASWQASVTTLDAVHRARAERLEVQVDLERTRADRRLAASQLNYLVGRDSHAPIEISSADLALPPWATAVAADPATQASISGDWTEELSTEGALERAELRELDHAITAAESGLSAARGMLQPTVAFAVDAGIQGRDYGIGSNERYVLASLVMSWNVTAWGAESARVREAALERDRLRYERDDALARMRLELESAALNARVALINLPSVAQRVEEADAAFRLVARRRDEGMATPLEFLDARASLTQAQLAAGIGETTALIRLAELDFAAGGDTDVMTGALRVEPRSAR
jgi:outer membrane protein TolC